MESPPELSGSEVLQAESGHRCCEDGLNVSAAIFRQ